MMVDIASVARRVFEKDKKLNCGWIMMVRVSKTLAGSISHSAKKVIVCVRTTSKTGESLARLKITQLSLQ